MAFLRSVARCNSLVSRKVSSAAVSGSVPASGSSQRGILFSDALSADQYQASLSYLSQVLAGGQLHQRRFRSVAATATSNQVHVAKQQQQQQNNPNSSPQRDPLDVGFNDPNAAFKSKTTFELIRAYFVYLLCSSEFLVENNMKTILFHRRITTIDVLPHHPHHTTHLICEKCSLQHPHDRVTIAIDIVPPYA